MVGDFRSLRTKQGGALADASLERFRKKLAAVMDDSQQSDAQAKATTLKDQYLANRDNLKALDHAIKLSLSHDGLRRFLPEKLLTAHVAAGRRYMAPHSRL